MPKKKKREPSPFPRGRPLPPGKVHSTKKDYDRKLIKQEEINYEEEEK